MEPRYHPVSSTATDSESGFDKENEIPTTPERPPKRWSSSKLSLCLSTVLFVLSFVNVWISRQRSANPTATQCIEELSMYSPANVAAEYSEYNFDNMFAHKTKYRGPPTPELEAEWEKLWSYGEANVPADKLPLLMTPDKLHYNWKRTPSGGYAAAIMVFHQLHCLDYIRQYTWGDYYERHNMSVPLKSNAVGKRMHADHCIEELRKTLMCYGDTTPFLTILDAKAPIGERADFDARHMCRNYEKIRVWMAENVVYPWESG